MTFGDLGEDPVLLAMGGRPGVRGSRRAGDVGDRRDVIPVDSMANPEKAGGDQQANALGGGSGGKEGGDEFGEGL
jgi:hypothetical protein